MEYKISVNDAQELIKRKILINKMSSANLNEHIKYMRNSIRMQYLTIDSTSEKIKLIDHLNSIMELQLGNFTAERQDACMALYEQINKLDEPSEQILKLHARMKEQQEEMNNYVEKINYLESQMPAQQTITNYHAKLNSNSNTTCQQDMINDPTNYMD